MYMLMTFFYIYLLKKEHSANFVNLCVTYIISYMKFIDIKIALKTIWRLGLNLLITDNGYKFYLIVIFPSVESARRKFFLELFLIKFS